MAVLLVVLMTALADPFEPDSFGPGHDARAYWAAPLDDPYEPGSVGQESAYLYSPAFLVALSPLRALPWPLFLGLWTAGLLAVLFWMARPLLFLPSMLLALPEIWGGNITILLAAAIVLGFSRSAAWAFPLLTKVTPGLGLLWFGVRREWLHFGLAHRRHGGHHRGDRAIDSGHLGRLVRAAHQQYRFEHGAGLGTHPARARLPAGRVVISYAAWKASAGSCPSASCWPCRSSGGAAWPCWSPASPSSGTRSRTASMPAGGDRGPLSSAPRGTEAAASS